MLVVVDAHPAQVVREQVAHLLVEDLDERNLHNSLCVLHLLQDTKETPDQPGHETKLLLAKGRARVGTDHCVGLTCALGEQICQTKAFGWRLRNLVLRDIKVLL